MNILLFGKIPPIQGGVSRATWRAAVDLAKAGHEVDVISNADAMPPGFRQILNEEDRARYDSVPTLHVYMTQAVSPFAYIPWTDPFLSQMIGVARRVVAERRPDVVIGWYFEPYGLAASIIGQILGIPVFLRHAGSDIGRLAEHPDLACAYRPMLEEAACVMTSLRGDAVDRLVAAGADPARIRRMRGSTLEPEFRNTDAMDLADQAARAKTAFEVYDLPDDLHTRLIEWNEAALEADDPIVGTYGKIAEVKGTYQLIDALDRLARAGRPVRYVGVWSATRGRFIHALRALFERPALHGRAMVLPPLAPWRVPAFIRSCDAVAFLENRFPIDIHGPQVPREVLACGVPLVLSGEIAEKLFFRDQLVDGRNAAIVPDPEDRKSLADVLWRVLRNPAAGRAIGHHGQTLSRAIEAGAPATDGIVELMVEMTEIAA